MSTPTLRDADLFSALDTALVAIEFAHITGASEAMSAAKREADILTTAALARGYIFDTINCHLGDEVQNLHGDTGTIVEMRASIAAPLIEVRWDAPSAYPVAFTAANLLAGELRHRR